MGEEEQSKNKKKEERIKAFQTGTSNIKELLKSFYQVGFAVFIIFYLNSNEVFIYLISHSQYKILLYE